LSILPKLKLFLTDLCITYPLSILQENSESKKAEKEEQKTESDDIDCSFIGSSAGIVGVLTDLSD
jgi:hypothetical protein